jgi:helix-turn-helix protein
MTTPEQALLARKTWRTVEPLHGMIYFVPEAAEAYDALGVHGRDGYFSSRSAPMGAVTADVVISTFFNFNPELVHHAIPKVWERTSPAALVAARFVAVDGACRRLLGDDVVGSDEMKKAAELARGMALRAADHAEGRPLCAGHVNVEWPDEPHLVLWHAQSILREFRGDGHIALLVTHGLSGIDALITHAAAGDVPAALLMSSRGWSDAQWDAACASMRERGWITENPVLAFTEWGAAQRQAIEDQTDQLAAAPYAALGEEGCAELRALARPWSKIFSDVLFR